VTLRRALLIGGLLGVGTLAKITFLLVVPLVVVVQLLIWLRRRELPLRRRAGLLAASWGVALIPPLLYTLRSAAVFEPGVQEEAGVKPPVGEDKLELASHVWQSFLPRLPFMNDLYGGAEPPAVHGMLEGPASRLGWWDDYGIGEPFATLILLGAVALVLFAIFTAARRRAWRLPLAVVLFASIGFSVLLVAALYAPPGFQVQGRYMGVLTACWALAVGVAVAALRPRRQALAAASLTVVMLGWSALALEATISRWYL
jgi:4-amino-4-deoxy-L-arabinose transferase-like glycosyltransferase